MAGAGVKPQQPGPLFSISNVIRIGLFAYFVLSEDNADGKKGGSSRKRKLLEGAAHLALLIMARLLKSAAAHVTGVIGVARLVASGKLRPDAVRLFQRAGDRKALVSCAGAVACGAFACYFGLARHVILLSLTMFALPLLQRFVHPYFWPYAAVVLGLTTALWLYEGMREMFVGVALFQAVPCLIALLLKMRALSTRPRLRLGVIAAVWLAAFVCIALPILSVALIALLRPEVLNEMIRYSGEPTKGAFINVGMRWQFVGAIETLMGMGGSGDVSSDPYRLLGVSMNANERDIQKRWRTLATEFHPDKTGNDPIKMAHFVRLQKAKELLLSGTSMELSTTNKDIMNERLLGLVQKSMGSFIVVCLWTVLSAMQLLRARGSDKSGGDGTMTMTAEAVEALGGEDNDASTNARGEHATAADGSERTAANTNDSGAAGVSSNEHATFAPDRVGGVRRRKPASKPRSGGG